MLNPYAGACPEGFTGHQLFGDDELVRLCPDHASLLHELGAVYDLAWGCR